MTQRAELLAIADLDEGAARIALRHITANLRQSDRDEILATMWTSNPDELVDRVMWCPQAGWIATLDGEPVAAVGVNPIWPGVWSGWAFGTDDFRKVGRLLTRHIRRFIIPMLLRDGAHRCEALTIEGHDEAHRWLESFGFTREATHPERGRNRETFHTYAARRREVEDVLKPRHERRNSRSAARCI